eukprot:Rmarinus@m.24668
MVLYQSRTRSHSHDKKFDDEEQGKSVHSSVRDVDVSAIRVRTLGSILGWFASNVMLSNVNKWLMDYTEFRFPVALTACHMLMAIILGYVTIPHLPESSRRPISWETQKKIVFLAAVFATSITCGNISLKYLYVSFQQMISATSPLVTIILDYIMRSKVHNRWVYVSMIPMSLGAILCSHGEINFSAIGVMFVAAATITRGMKSIMQGILLAGEDRLHPIVLLYYMAIPSFALLIVAAGILEGQQIWLVSDWGWSTRGLVLLSSLVAFLVNLMNFLVTKYTSAVTLQVLGNVKTVLAIVVSVIIFRNPVTMQNIIGCSIILGGVYMYNRFK